MVLVTAAAALNLLLHPPVESPMNVGQGEDAGGVLAGGGIGSDLTGHVICRREELPQIGWEPDLRVEKLLDSGGHVSARLLVTVARTAGAGDGSGAGGDVSACGSFYSRAASALATAS